MTASYLNSIFKKLKFPTSVFNINHISNDFVNITGDIYIRCRISIYDAFSEFFFRYAHFIELASVYFKINITISRKGSFYSSNVYNIINMIYLCDDIYHDCYDDSAYRYTYITQDINVYLHNDENEYYGVIYAQDRSDAMLTFVDSYENFFFDSINIFDDVLDIQLLDDSIFYLNINIFEYLDFKIG